MLPISDRFKIPSLSKTKLVGGLLAATALFVVGSNSFFYAEPGYVYHVRTVLGAEVAVTDVGYQFYPWGRWNAWKRAMTVQAVSGGNNGTYAEVEGDETSSSLPPVNIVFLDQVDVNAEATVRFSIPSDAESFLRMAHEYRTPANLLRTALVPAFKETLQATASLMGAEEYYSGARTQFNTEFENQMSNGIYQVRREEVKVPAQRDKAEDSSAAGAAQPPNGDDSKVVYEVRKVLTPEGKEMRKVQKFQDFGITMVDARITNMTPNNKYLERMQLKQKASADRAIAREQRIQEEEQRLLAIAKGEREQAEKRAVALVEQVQKTTGAETEKLLALTAASKLKEQASIEQATAAIQLETARIEAQTTRQLAEAEAYKRRVILQADNALEQKLATEVKIHEQWAAAYAKRAVPVNVFGGGTSGATVGADGEVKAFMQMLTLDAAKRLAYDRQMAAPADDGTARPK